MNSGIITFSLILGPSALIIEFVVVLYYLKIKTKTTEFNVLTLILINLILVAEISVLLSGVIIDNIILIYILGGLSAAVNVVLFYRVGITLLRQKEKINFRTNKLERIIDTGLEASINVANNATELAASANEVNSSAEEIAATTMEVSLKAQNQTEALDKINQMAQEIEIISNVVSNISEQTNLLALNASIEAGRAGEHGRGFAVVAEKVQKLAEEAKTSVEKTSDIVEKISKSIQEAAMGSAEISGSMEEISSSAEEQTASMEEISATAEKLGLEAQNLKVKLSQQESDNDYK